MGSKANENKDKSKKENIGDIITPLLAWYDAGRRILPWREDPSPYHVWISEIMLQQTRVEAVKPYYDRFMQALPDVSALAAAQEDELLKLWEGLGYYNRVRNLHRAAVQIMEEYGGVMPENKEDLLTLAGIGSYTAGAISSIAYGHRETAVDGNVLRVLARLRMDERDIARQSVKKQVEDELLPVMPGERPGDVNQALMELGAMICTPNGEPKCSQCPWEMLCLAHKEGRETKFPVKTPKKPRTVEEKTVLILLDDNCVALHKRPEKGLLAGLYEFPCLDGNCSEAQVLSYLKEMGLSVIRIEPLPASKHIFTHREWHMCGYLVRVDELEGQKIPDGYFYAQKSEVRDTYPIPSAYSVYRNMFYLRQGSIAD